MEEILTKRNFKLLIVFTIIYIFGVFVGTMTIDLEKQENYIQNLEEKLNIYEQEYDEFALKDALLLLLPKGLVFCAASLRPVAITVILA